MTERTVEYPWLFASLPAPDVFDLVNCNCDAHPCNNAEPERMRLDKCADIPKCLDDELNIDGVLALLNE